jgi:alpha-N-acetylglucosaminidase
VIVAFPDVEPFVIQTSTASISFALSSKNFVVKDASNDAYEQPHIWYDTKAVIHALELFLQYGDEVSDSSTFR